MISLANSFDKCFAQHYQPIVNIQNLSLQGHEALLRPRGFSRDTESLVRQMERSGAIVDLDLWSVRQVLERISKTSDSGRISINLSALNICDPIFHEELDWLLSQQENRLNLNRLSFEITESYPLTDITMAKRFVALCHGHGITVGLDDFGTGHAKLSVATDLQLDYIKLASRLTTNLLQSKPARTLVERATKLAHDSGMKVVAEHIESPMQYAWLRDCHVELGQGWLFAKASSQLRSNPCFKQEVESSIQNTSLRSKHRECNVYSFSAR